MSKIMQMHDANKAAFLSFQLKREQQPGAFDSSVVQADDNPSLFFFFLAGKDIKRYSHELSVM